RTSKPSIPLLF
ncbi:hypothetical protein CP02DC22_0043B, partial [Chlamydia psittaci 02DC22]